MEQGSPGNTLTQALKGFGLFIKEFVFHPSYIGAAIPSSKILAQKMAAAVPYCENSLVIELGAGTGVITQALLESSITNKNIIIIERSKALCKHLRQRFPDLTIINEDAQALEKIIAQYQLPVCAIVSSLPLRSLPPQVVLNIETAATKILMWEGLFIQFTYDLRSNKSNLLTLFEKTRSEYVWLNIPPAKIELYKIKSSDI